jgi:hypothetical protein
MPCGIIIDALQVVAVRAGDFQKRPALALRRTAIFRSPRR